MVTTYVYIYTYMKYQLDIMETGDTILYQDIHKSDGGSSVLARVCSISFFNLVI